MANRAPSFSSSHPASSVKIVNCELCPESSRVNCEKCLARAELTEIVMGISDGIFSKICDNNGLPPSKTSGLGVFSVKGQSLVAKPPARMIQCMLESGDWRVESGCQMSDLSIV